MENKDIKEETYEAGLIIADEELLDLEQPETGVSAEEEDTIEEVE